jgi:hypothetical protein
MIPWWIPMPRLIDYCGSGVDPLDYRIKHAGHDPQQFYLGKASNCSLAQHIKEAYGKVKKGKRCYKLASI